MASFSSTRNKIQAILSSFMHEKDELSNERNSERDIAENPGLLSMLCQPRNRENFYDRVETFSWPMKPLYLSPQHCALYGWENRDVDLLTCISCKATLDGMIGTEWDTDTYNSTCARLRSSIINGHSKFCPWKETPCPESFLSLSARTSQEWKASFEDACRNLLSLEGNLPVLKREAFQELEITEDVLSILSSYIADGDSSSYHQDIVDTICVLALCGWNTSDSSGILCCTACHREAGLWNFHSLKSVTLINNDGGMQGDVEVEEVVRGNNGQHGSQGVMEEDMPGEVADVHNNEETQRDSASTQEDMVCDVGIIRDEGSLETEHLPSNIESGNDEQELTGTQEVIMDNDEYTTVDTECENKVTGYILVHNVNESDRALEGEEGTCKMDPEATLENENVGQVQNTSEVQIISQVQNISQEVGTLGHENENIEVSRISPLHENILEETQGGNQISNQTEPFVLNNIASKTEDEDSFENTSKQVELQVNTESQPVEITSSEQNSLLPEQNTLLSEQNTLLPEQNTPLPEQNILLSEQNTLLPEQSTLLSEQSTLLSEQNTLLSEQNTLLPEQNTLLSEQNTLLPEQSTVPEQTSLSEEEPLPEQEHLPEEEPLPEQEPLSEEEPLPEQEHLPEEEPLPEQEPLSEEEPLPEQEHLPEEVPLPEQEPLSEEEPLSEQGTRKGHEILSQPGTSEQETRDLHELDKTTQPASFSGNEYTTDSNIEPDQGGCEPGPGMSMEPSRLFSAGFFSPAHSRQDSLIVELGEDSMSERMQSIQSDLLDRGETASQMDSCRSLSELSDGDVGEPSSKRLKIDDDIEKIEFDVLAEHRNWCPWVTAVPSARNTAENIQKSPGWQILLEQLIQSTPPGKQPVVKQTPPTQVWKSVRRLFHDCQTTIMRSTKSHVLEGKV